LYRKRKDKKEKSEPAGRECEKHFSLQQLAFLMKGVWNAKLIQTQIRMDRQPDRSRTIETDHEKNLDNKKTAHLSG